MKTKLMALVLLAGGSVFAQSRISVGVQFGGGYPSYYEPAPVAYAGQPPCPGPDFYWVDGYWSQNYGRRAWVAGSWNRRPITPRYEGRYEGRYESRYEGRNENRDRRYNDARENRRDDRNRGYERGNSFRGR